MTTIIGASGWDVGSEAAHRQKKKKPRDWRPEACEIQRLKFSQLRTRKFPSDKNIR
jgi:hypothetical protein